MESFELIYLVLKVLILDEQAFNILTLDRIPSSQTIIFSEKLLYARNQLKLFLRRQVLVFIEEQLELLLQALDKLFK